jgi:hypothetical protein
LAARNQFGAERVGGQPSNRLRDRAVGVNRHTAAQQSRTARSIRGSTANSLLI